VPDTTTSSRLLTLLSLLQARRDWSGGELADRLGVSGRTVRRDVERLRRLGYPVESLSGPAGGYRLRAGTAMPPLLVDDEEAIAIAIALRTAAGTGVAGIDEAALRALVKLEHVLPSPLRRRVQALGAVTAAPGWPGPTVDPESLSVIAAASRDHERVRFAYTGRDGATARREVEPHALVTLGGRWYLLAWDVRRAGWRTFRLDRASRPSPAGTRFTPRALPARDAATFVSQSLSSAPYRYNARLTLFAPAASVTAGRPYLQSAITPLDAETCEYVTGDDDLRWLAARIAMLGVDFVVHEPPELVAHLAALARRFGRAEPR
jgi:predicted DNA-binding transcriptional regulator YafY